MSRHGNGSAKAGRPARTRPGVRAAERRSTGAGAPRRTGAARSLGKVAGAEVAGAEVAGAEVAGAEVAGAEVAGAEVAGAGVAGAEVAGAEVAGAAADEPYLTPRLLHLRHLVWAILLGWLALAVVVVALVTVL